MAAVEEESLESWLNKATSPMNRQEDWEYIMGFCDQINKELEGPQIATRLLSHKAQSPQEWEALQALTVLEACMKNCDRRFHNEVGKFRFLNELIKVVSPKYLGSRASEKVKKRVIELIFSWTLALPDETKIAEAYQMLKKQGIVLEDPMIEEDKTLVPPPRPKDTLFEDEEKAKLLDRLLKSKNPEDLQAANRLIKTMVKEDQARMERVGKRIKAVEEVDGNVKLLSEMLAHYRREDASDDDREVMKELHERCEKLRPTLFKLASETADNDEGLAEILRANDDLTRVMNSYRRVVENREVNGDLGKLETGMTLDGGGGDVSALIELAGLDAAAPPPQAPQPKVAPPLPPAPIYPVVPPPPARHAGNLTGTAALERAASVLDDELVSLAIDDPVPNAPVDPAVVNWDSIMQDRLRDVAFPPPAAAPSSQNVSLASTPSHGTPRADAAGPSGLEELDLLGKTLLQQSLPPQALQVKWAAPQAKLTLNEMQSKQPVILPALFATQSTLLPGAAVPPQPTAAQSQGLVATLGIVRQSSLELEAGQSPLHGGTSSSQLDASLANVVVPLESIKPSNIPPVNAYDKNGLRVLLHFAKESPLGRADVLVVVVSMFSTAPLFIRNIMLQAAVPKTMKVKLQPPSGTELPPFNPVLPPSAITQVMLLANAHKDKVRLRYKLTYTLGQQSYSEVGEVEEFPPVDKWGYL